MEFCFGVKRRRRVPLRRAGGLREQRPRSQRQLAPAATCAPSCPARDPGSALKMQLAWFSAFSRIQAASGVGHPSVKIQENHEISSPCTHRRKHSKQTFHKEHPRVCKLHRSVVSDAVRPPGLWPASLLHPWDFPGEDTGVGCHALLLPVKGRDQRRQRIATCGPGRLSV